LLSYATTLISDFMAPEKPNMTDLQFPRMSQAAQFGEFSLDFRKMELCRADQPIGLTLREFKVLKFLVTRPSVVVSRRKLIGSAWPKRKRSSYRTVDNCIAKLRKKIENDPDCPVLIRTVHGVGYKFVPQENSGSVEAQSG
jgi:DNA-binding response OmpR family regulator